MFELTKYITLDREKDLAIPTREVIRQLSDWVNERYEPKEFYSYFRWEVDCHFMTAAAVDNYGRIVFIVELDEKGE